MKKEGFKRNSHLLKPRLKSRECLSELNYNSFETRLPLKRRGPVKRKAPNFLEMLPQELHLEMLGFLEAEDLVKSVQAVSRYWREIANHPLVWKRLGSVDLRWGVKCTECLVERRSKGKVFRGIDRATQERVALRKVYLDVTNAGYDDGVPTSLLREISYLKECHHKNVGRILRAEVVNRTVYICNEVGEHNLKDYIKKLSSEKSTVSRGIIQNITRQICEGLSYMHHKGLIHRNLKPDNILVTSDGTVKIVDLTLSRLICLPHYPYTPEDPKERERSGREARRLWYRSPELLFRKEIYSSEVDMWSLGCLLAEMCTGQPLFNGESEIEQLFKIFRVTGVPKGEFPIESKAFPNWEAVDFAHATEPKSTQVYKNLVKELIPARESTLKLLSKLAPVLRKDGLEFLQKCLRTSTRERMTASQALKHPFLEVPSCCDTLFTSCQLNQFVNSLHNLESQLLPNPNYLSSQENISASMRSILVDWLLDVSVHFEVMGETLHLAVGYIDRVLSKMAVDKSKLQLVGVTCMKIADVFNEKSKEYYRQENSTEYAYITADEYTAQQVVEMEKQILKLLDFRLVCPTTLSFLKAFALKLEIDEETCRVGKYLADLLLLSYPCLKFAPSLLASGCLYLSCLHTNSFPEDLDCSGLPEYPHSEFEEAVQAIRDIWLEARSNPAFSRFESINGKHQELNPRNLWPPSLHPREWIH